MTGGARPSRHCGAISTRPEPRPTRATRSHPGSVIPMTEQNPEHTPEQPVEDPMEEHVDATPAEDPGDRQVDSADDGSDVAPTTGHPAVDEVLRSLEDLEGRPVDEHVAVFEKAHEELRRALSSAGDDTVPPSGG